MVQNRFVRVSPETTPQAEQAQSPQKEAAGQAQSPQKAFCDGAVSPRSRGALAKGYEDRFGAVSAIIEQDASFPTSTPRPSRKPGVQSFTDPMNPLGRKLAKQMTRLEDSRNDTDRAGARTRNPGMIPRDFVIGGQERAMSEDGRRPLIAHRYSTSGDWRPGKRCPDYVGSGEPAPSSLCESLDGCSIAPMSPRCGKGVRSIFSDKDKSKSTSNSRLQNYLNDMKRSPAAKRSIPSTPSDQTLRMNDERVKLPAERRQERELFKTANSTAELFSRTGDEPTEKSQSARMLRSYSCDPRFHQRGDTSEREDIYGFIRKREVSGKWTKCGGPDLLHHSPGHCDPPSTPRRAERIHAKADQRFAEMVAHMKAAAPEQKAQFEQHKARSECSRDGFMSHDMSPC